MFRVIGAAVAHLLYTEMVTGSNPVSPIINKSVKTEDVYTPLQWILLRLGAFPVVRKWRGTLVRAFPVDVQIWHQSGVTRSQQLICHLFLC